MNDNGKPRTIKHLLGKDYVFMDELSKILGGDTDSQQNFIDLNRDIVVYYQLPIASFLSGMDNSFMESMSKVKAFQTMGDNIIFTYKGSIVFKVSISKRSSHPYRAILYSEKNPRLRFISTNLSTCIKLVSLYMYNHKLI